MDRFFLVWLVLAGASVPFTQGKAQADEPGAPGHLALLSSGAGIRLLWTNGVLQSTPQLQAEWTDATNVENPLHVTTAGESQYFRLRAAQPSNISGNLFSRGHPLHARNFALALNGNPLAAIWSGSAEFDFTSGLPGVNLVHGSHPWYRPVSASLLINEGVPNVLPDWQPAYLGRLFQIGSAACRFVGHGGGNSLVGFDNYASCSDGRSKGMWILEVDVLISGDGVPFLSHDWTAVKVYTGLDYGASAGALIQTGRITLLSEVMADFDGLVLDLIHNSDEDALRIVDHMEAHYPDRIRSDVYLQVYQRPVYHYIRNLDPDLKLSFNLASWSAWGITPDWKTLIADIVAETDFYVINPSTMVTADMVTFLNGNGLANTFVPVMHTHSPQEIIRLHQLAPQQTSPMILSPDLLPGSWPPDTNCHPSHPLFRFTFDGPDPYVNEGHSPETMFAPAQNVSRTTDANGTLQSAILTQSLPPSQLELTSESVARLNADRALDFSMTLSARATRFNTPQVLALATQSGNPRYVAGFYLYEGNAYFIVTHPNNTQTWVPAGAMTDRRWHSLAATVAGGQITTYQNGLIVSASRPIEPLVRRPVSSFLVGCDPLIPERAFDGALDDLAWYPYALSQDEVWSWVKRGPRSCPPHTLASWPVRLPPGPATHLVDSSRKGALPLVLLPDTMWVEDRSGSPSESIRTDPLTTSGAKLDPAGISQLNASLGSSWTLSGWVKPAQTDGTRFLWGGQNRARALRYHLGFAAYGTSVQFFVRPESGDQIVAAAGVLTAGSWHHLAATCDGMNLRTFVNGSPVAVISLNSPLFKLDPFTDFSVGVDPVDPSRTADAAFDELALHPFPLSPDEIAQAAVAASVAP